MIMILFANAWVFLVGLLHLWFLILEMVLWQKPLGLKTFRNTPEKAEITSVLAANQGLYNGFLAAGLWVSLAFSDVHLSFAFQVFFLSCVIIAALYGAYSVNKRIFWIQGMPAVIAVMLVIWNSAKT